MQGEGTALRAQDAFDDFDKHALAVSARQMRVVAIVVGVCDLALWPFDGLLYPEPVVEGFLYWRITVLVLAVVLVLVLPRDGKVGRAMIPVVITILAIATTSAGYGLGIAGAIDTPYFHTGYMLPVAALPLLVGLGWRIVATVAMSGSFLIAYFVARPSELANPLLPSVFVFAVSLLVGCILMGQVYYRLTRQSWEQRRELASHASRLEAVDRLKNELFANVSHEFRTPLMLVMVHLRAMHAADPTHTDAALRNCARLLILVDELLELARLGTREQPARKVRIDLARLVADVGLAFGGEVQDQPALSLEGVSDPVMVWGDPQQLRTLVYNLLSNAFKFSDPTTRRVRVSISGDEREARVEVTDNGVGIAPEHKDAIFERFVQTQQGDARRYGGVGLGLSLVKEIAAAHGGSVTVDSKPGAGSKFTVAWPQDAPREEAVIEDKGRAEQLEVFALARSVPPPSAEQPKAPHGPRTSRVLVVEDDPELRSYLASTLHRVFHVDAAVDGQEGLERAKAEPPDLVVTDLMTPRASGLDLVRAMRAIPELARVPVLIITARPGHDARSEAYHAGADDYLPKPFEDEELLIRALNLLALRRNEKDLSDKNSELEARVAARTSELRRLTQHLTRAREDERKRLARELHDEFGQVLTGLRLELGMAKTAAPTQNEHHAHMDRLLDQAFDELRDLVSELRPQVLDELGLEAAVDWCITRLEERTGAKCELSVSDLRRPAPNVETAAFRIVQETLTNVARHAQAGSVQVRMTSDEACLAITISDDGVGFDARGPKRGFGLLGMAERAEQLGGSFRVESKPGDGTVTRVELPLNPPTDELS